VQSATIVGSSTNVRLDETRPATLAAYAITSPTLVFHAGELALSSGPAAHRRTLLDRLALFLNPMSADHRSRYLRALQSRQRLLRGLDPGNTPAIDAFEDLCAVHGAALTDARAQAANALESELAPAFARIAAPDLRLAMSYVPGGALDPQRAREHLAKHRAQDARRTTAAFGPHRDDLQLTLGGHPARLVASQGQHRTLTLALKLAELAAIAAARRLQPILLLDDISSELDAARTSALFAALAGTSAQIFVTTTRPDLVEAASSAHAPSQRYRLENGQLGQGG
jgi:DNA replication and repair protein RecF